MDFPTLETQRLILNRPTANDLKDVVCHLDQTSEFSENTLNIPFPYKKEDAEFWIREIINKGFENHTNFTFAIRLKNSPQLIGGIGIRTDRGFQKAEVGYWLAKEFWNKGYASEALKKVIEYGFDNLGMNKIYAAHFDHNPASGKVLQKAGMKFEGVLVQEAFKNNQYLDLIRYYILKSQFEAAK